MDYSYVDTSAWVSLADNAEASHERVAAALRDRRGCRPVADDPFGNRIELLEPLG